MNTVLIVEDEKLIRQGIRAMVQRAPVQVETVLEAKNGEEALEILGSRPVDVMFTDIRMPKMDGIALAGKLKEFPNPPLTVVISGFEDFSYAVNVLRNGVRDYILKPVEREKIYEILVKLNEEIEQKKKESQNKNQIGQQILRSLLMDSGITQSEMDAIIAQYSDLFFAEPFIAICAKAQDEASPCAECVLLLTDADGRSVSITKETDLQSVLDGGLNNRCVGISNTHMGLGKLRQAYEEALSARDWAFVLGKAVRFSEIAKEPAKHEVQKQMDMIVQLLGASNADEAKKVLGQLLRLSQSGQLAPEDFILTMEQLVGKIISTYRIVLPSESSLLRFQKICDFESGLEYYTEFCLWMNGFCDRLTEEFEDYQNKQKIMQAVRYIQKNFLKQLNMAMVSNEVNMNYSLFSYLFKHYTGTNFVSYLQNLRLEESKRLLAETDLKIIEISAQVGFQTEKHFMKLFKATCGVSPSEYRKNMSFWEESDS